jgi:uncharacterized protein (DUF885 family)
MRCLIVLVALASACAAAPPPTPATPSGPLPPDSSGAGALEDAAIARAEQDYVDLLTSLSPEHATELGIHAHDADLDDCSIAAFEQGILREDRMLRELRARFDKPHASRAARTDLALMTHALAVNIRYKRDVRPPETQPDLYTSPMGALFLMMARDYAPAADRAHNALLRMEKIPAVIAAAKANLRNPPRLWTQIGIERAASAKDFFEGERPLLEAALPAEKARIDTTLRAATEAYVGYRAFLEKEVLPRSTGNFAAGRPLFELMVHEGYFLGEGVDELYALGEKIFARTDAQMSEVARHVEPHAGGWPEVVARLKGKHPTADGLLGAYRTEVQRARAFLVAHDVVPFPPDDVLDVVDTPPFQRTTIQAAYDAPPPFDAVTKGLFFVTPVDRTWSPERQDGWLRENDDGDIVDTAVHEAYPGHHLQLSFARRNPSLVRKATETAILEEGWALYSEELMAELGYYTEEQRLMQLEWTLVRAARVMLDIGLHVRGMTFEQAVAFLTDKVHLERDLAVSEAKRYTQMPTQPMSYLIGREMIFRMRERYRVREGSAYTLKRFHADLLSRGSIAPGLLEQEMFEP